MFLEGAVWAIKTVRQICPDDSFLQKIINAVDTLRNQASSKRSKVEQKTVSPSDFAKSKTQVEYLHDSCQSTSLHVGLQFQAFGKFLDIANNRHE